MRPDAIVRPLRWESSFFGKRMGLLNVDAAGEDLSLSDLLAFDVVEAKVQASRLDIVDRLIEHGFRLAETEVSYGYTGISDRGEDQNFRVAGQADVSAVQSVVRKAFQFSRFRPPWFAQSASADYYATWAANAIRGTFDDECLLIEDADALLGFVTIRDEGDCLGRIGLLATAPAPEHKGTGRRLVGVAHKWCASRGIQRLSVVTQLGNSRAVRLYERTGGILDSAAYWLYWSENA